MSLAYMHRFAYDASHFKEDNVSDKDLIERSGTYTLKFCPVTLEKILSIRNEVPRQYFHKVSPNGHVLQEFV